MDSIDYISARCLQVHKVCLTFVGPVRRQVLDAIELAPKGRLQLRVRREHALRLRVDKPVAQRPEQRLAQFRRLVLTQYVAQDALGVPGAARGRPEAAHARTVVAVARMLYAQQAALPRSTGRRRVVARLAAKGLAITQRQMRRRFGDELRPRRGAVDRAGRRGPRTDGRWSWGQRRRRAFARWLRRVGRRRRARGAADHVQCGVRKVALLDVARRLQRRPAARAHRHRGSIVRMRRILGLRTPRLGHLDSESSAASRHCYRTWNHGGAKRRGTLRASTVVVYGPCP
jgi:hypothetical protein